MSSCLRKGSRPYAVICPHTKQMYIQKFEPKCCSLGTPGRKYTCKYFGCEKCHRAYKTCKELKKHQALAHGYKVPPSCNKPFTPTGCPLNPKYPVTRYYTVWNCST